MRESYVRVTSGATKYTKTLVITPSFARAVFNQSNPDSHLSSAKTFDEMGLPPALLKGVQNMG